MPTFRAYEALAAEAPGMAELLGHRLEWMLLMQFLLLQLANCEQLPSASALARPLCRKHSCLPPDLHGVGVAIVESHSDVGANVRGRCSLLLLLLRQLLLLLGS